MSARTVRNAGTLAFFLVRFGELAPMRAPARRLRQIFRRLPESDRAAFLSAARDGTAYGRKMSLLYLAA